MDPYAFLSQPPPLHQVEGFPHGEPEEFEMPFSSSRFSRYDCRMRDYAHGPYCEFREKSLSDYYPPKIDEEIWSLARQGYQGRKTLVHEIEDGVAKVSYYLTRSFDDSKWGYSVYAHRRA